MNTTLIWVCPSFAGAPTAFKADTSWCTSSLASLRKKTHHPLVQLTAYLTVLPAKVQCKGRAGVWLVLFPISLSLPWNYTYLSVFLDMCGTAYLCAVTERLKCCCWSLGSPWLHHSSKEIIPENSLLFWSVVD